MLFVPPLWGALFLFEPEFVAQTRLIAARASSNKSMVMVIRVEAPPRRLKDVSMAQSFEPLVRQVVIDEQRWPKTPVCERCSRFGSKLSTRI